MKLVELFATTPRSVVTSLALLVCVGVGVVDGLIGPAYSLVPFYLVPVTFAAWFAGRRAGYLLACVGALIWFLAEVMGKAHSKPAPAVYWNDLMELLLFLLTALVVSALRQAAEREREIARTDYLTGLPNRRRYYEVLDAEIRRNQRYGEPFSVAYLDIDDFKSVNDTKGHEEGDKLLRLAAKVMAAAVRSSDTVARLGGDEFALLLPETAGDAALAVAAKVRQLLIKDVESRWPVSFSIGVVTYLKAPATIDEVIGRADRLMYSVKGASKDALRQEVVGP